MAPHFTEPAQHLSDLFFLPFPPLKAPAPVVAPGARGDLAASSARGPGVVRAPVGNGSLVWSPPEPAEASKSKSSPPKSEAGWRSGCFFPGFAPRACLSAGLGGAWPSPRSTKSHPLFPPRLLRLRGAAQTTLPASSGMQGAAPPGLYKTGAKRGRGAAGVPRSGGGMPRGASRQEPVSVYSASLINPAAGARAGGPALLVCD